jgi:cyclophilin family peptidyl-prolyl cis-trans isomerase
MSKRSRERQLAKLAARRASERRRRRRKRGAAISVAAVVALAGLVLLAFAFLGGEEPAKRAGRTPKTPKASAAACGAEVPRGAGKKKALYKKAPEMTIDAGATYTATLQTSCGKIQLELLADRAPVTVNNFVALAQDGFYDGLTFHRVVPGFVIQGGDPNGDGTGSPGYQFDNEISRDMVFDREGLLAMANSGPDTNGSQFFITLGPAEHLDGKHTIFGEVVGGMKVAQRIAKQPLDGEMPDPKVYIEKLTISKER